MPRGIMCHFMREDAREFGFVVGRFEQTSFDEKISAWKRERIDFTRLEDRDMQRDLQV